MGDLTKPMKSPWNMMELDLGTTTLTDTTTNELDLEVIPEEQLYPWAKDDNEKRRAFIFEYFNYNPEYAPKFQLESLALIDKWLSGR